ncbi:MAG TPA: hypothetical protein VKB38_05990 [Terracidiphilus sp.]|nr:hypothetical protein [Terracidiphilus sp.]
MPKNPIIVLTLPCLFVATFTSIAHRAHAQAPQAAYAAMAPLNQYLIADQNAEIALARSGAPATISKDAEVMVLGRDGYTTAANGTNGFMCLVERGWGAATTEAEFWNPKVRSPICFNAAAARTFAPIFLLKTKLVLAGKSKKEILAATDAAFESKELPTLDPAAMCYMMSKQQYLNDGGKSWHPHVMFFVPGDSAQTWGANLDGSPMIAVNDPEERATIMMMWAAEWSDGSPAPPMKY